MQAERQMLEPGRSSAASAGHADAESQPTRRVLAVIRWPVGGIRTYIKYHYPILAEHGYRFTFVGPDDPTFHDFATDCSGWPDTEFHAARVTGKTCHLRPVVRTLLRTRQIDLLHSHGLKAATQVVLANYLSRTPHIVTSHDVFLPQHFAGWKGPLKRQVMQTLLGQADRVICVGGPALQNHIQNLPRLARKTEKLVAIRNGIDTRRFDRNRSDIEPANLRERLGVDQNVALLGFFGRFMEQKGFLPLLSAIKSLQEHPPKRPFHLVAVGSGDFENYYRREITRLELDSLITILPAVPDIAPMLFEVDVVVMPSLWEACGLLAMEAMSAGTPLIVSDCDTLPELAHDTPARIAGASDAAAWDAALREAIDAPWTAAARSYAPTAQTRFDCSQSADLLRTTFEDVLSDSSRLCTERTPASRDAV